MGFTPGGEFFASIQLVRLKRRRKENWIASTIVVVKRPETFLVRVTGNDRRFVHANHLIPDDVRGLGSHVEKAAPDVLKTNPSLNFRRRGGIPQFRCKFTNSV